MSDSSKKPRVRKAPTSFREQAASQQAKDSKQAAKTRHRVSKVLYSPFKWLGRGLKFIFSPFGFLLWPFKTKIGRKIGRILAIILLINYFRGAFREVKKVTWPRRRETWKLTLAVFIFATVFGTIIAITDYGLDKLFKRLILK